MKKRMAFILMSSVLALSVSLSACTPKNHTHNLTYHAAKNATCLEEGIAEHFECSDCGKFFKDAEGATETSRDSLKIDATGHLFSDRWSRDEEAHWHAAVCGHNEEIKDREMHNFVDNRCTVCNELAYEDKSEVLSEAAAFESLTYEEFKSERFSKIIASANTFAAKLSEAILKDCDLTENVAVSPISVYMALAVTAEGSGGKTREQILSVLGVTYEQLHSDFELLYRALNATKKDDNGKIVSMLDTNNSIWLDKSLEAQPSTLKTLAEKYFCNARKTDFAFENALANRAIQKFVKEKTHGLIDQDFNLSTDTVFAIINTLYLKDVWNGFGEELQLTDKTYSFNEKSIHLLEGYYREGRAYEADTFTHFYTQTYNGYKLKFLLPKEGRSVKEIFTEENIAKINSLRFYDKVDSANKYYFTRCLFPEFEASYGEDIVPVLKNTFGDMDLFSPRNCDFSPLTGDSVSAYCSAILHMTKLKVDRKGIEGAAVTIVVSDATSAPDEHEEIYLDFVLDRSFGYVLTDRYDTILFTGIVDKV